MWNILVYPTTSYSWYANQERTQCNNNNQVMTLEIMKMVDQWPNFNHEWKSPGISTTARTL
jgi:hypothetical protein